MTANMTLSSTEITNLYNKNYFEGMCYSSYQGEEAGLRKNFLKRLQDLQKALPSTNQLSLFEVGCAYGYFLSEAQTLFKQVEGIDISPHAIQMAKSRFNLNVTCGDFLQKNEEKQYDVICMWDTIEHLLRPDLFIEKSANLLNKNGLIAINTGDIDSLNARMRGRHWRLIHPPQHLHYFSKATLSKLLQRYGFEIIHVQYPAVYRSLRMILYLACQIRQDKTSPIVSYLNRMPWLDFDIPINLFDLMFIIARKHT